MVKTIKVRIKQLAEAHDAVDAQQKQELLLTKRQLANFIVASAINTCSLVRPPIEKRLLVQLIDKAKEITNKVKTSENPVPIAVNFYNECFAVLEKSGTKTVILS